MSSFFLPVKGKGGKERKRRSVGVKKSKSSKRTRKITDEAIVSDSDIPSSDDAEERENAAENEESDQETAQEKRLRLTKQVLDRLAEEEQDKADDEETTRDLLKDRLRDDVLEQKGRLQRKLAAQYLEPDPAQFKWLRGHRLSLTCLVVTPDDQFLYTGSKDCSIIKWRLDGLRKEAIVSSFSRKKGTDGRHTGHVLSLAISSDGKFLASGGRDKMVLIWDVKTNELLHTFKGHRDAVSGLAFRKATHQLFSCSHDRTVKIWNLDEMAYVETLFGHQEAITGIDSLLRERAVTSGGNDRTVRVWKVAEESQLVFNGHKASIDCIKQINEEHFISGSQDGSIALWNVAKKKPAVLVPNAHGMSFYYEQKPKRKDNHQDNGIKPMFKALMGKKDVDKSDKEEDAYLRKTEKEAWVTSVSAIPNSDLAVSGSSDSRIRFWVCGENFRSLSELFEVPMVGFANAMAFSNKGDFLAVAVGQEHKLGRWWQQKDAQNGVCIIPLIRH